MKIIVLGNYTKALVLFRGPLIKRFVELGHNVIAYAPEDDLETSEALRLIGAEFRRLPFDRTGINVFRDIFLLLRLWRILSGEKPEILLLYTIKPVIFGSLAARLARIRHCYSIITGMGYVFIGEGVGRWLLRQLVCKLYKAAISFNDGVFILNRDDLATLSDHGIISESTSFKLIHGEGIDTREYTEHDVGPTRISIINRSGIDLLAYKEAAVSDSTDLVFLLIARLLKDKGIGEFVDAARSVKCKHPNARFWIVGPVDSNPAAFTQAEVQRWAAEGVVEYHGETRDVRPYIRKSSVYVLPSYREGIPRTILEAMAMGRPIITTDAPGCRETVVNGDNGFLVPVKDVRALAHAMEQFIMHPELIEKMGKRSREIAEAKYDVNKVNEVILRAMGLI